MIDFRFIDGFLKNFFLNICIFYVFVKITNYKKISNIKIIVIGIGNLLISVIYAVLMIHRYVLLSTIISFLLICFIITYITKNKLEDSVFSNFISSGISYITFIFSSLIISCLVCFFLPNIKENNPIIVCIIFIVEMFLLQFLFKIKRFKNGFAFLKNDKYNNFKFIGVVIVIVLLVLYSFLSRYKIGVNESLICIILLISIAFIIFIKKQITLSYKQMLKEDTIIQLENELEAEKIKNEKITHELEVFAKINHKYSTRISALESYVTTCIDKLNNDFNTEFADELFNAKELVDNLSKEYTNELSKEFKYAKKLPKTNILSIDNIINYFHAEANKNDIEFDLKINCEIHNLVENFIPQNKLETLLADHIKDSIIAINHNTNKLRSIVLAFDNVNKYYEIKIYDTGAEFEVSTLLKLGLEAVTTYKDSGGSGIGFMTTFETMKECNASLIIEEYEKGSNKYTKSITIRFDGKNEYKICSYRADIIKIQSTDNRIIIKNL